jgi:SP family sugar:H+ symporter-like MFS transporter
MALKTDSTPDPTESLSVSPSTPHIVTTLTSPLGIQFAWAFILGLGLFLLPESPRWYIKKGRVDDAARALSRVRGQPQDSAYIQEELAEVIANFQHETELMPHGGYFASWAECFKGSLRNPGSNLRRTILGTSLQMMQQWTGVNFM